MSTNLIRMKFAAVAAKIETTPGTDSIGGTPLAADYIGTDCEIQFDPQVLDIPEYNGSLDRTARQIGGLRPRLRLRMPLRGSGTAGTAPEWGRMLLASTFGETVTSSAVGAPTAATAGTTTTVTAATPFGTTAQQYRGMPLSLAGDQTGTTAITNYTAARVITVGDTRTAMTTSTTLQIPVNVLYSPTSDESVYKTLTIYVYMDGLLWVFTGALGTASLELTAGGIGYWTFELRAQFASKTATALPALAATQANARIAVVPPRWVLGRSQFNRTRSQVRALTLNAGVNVILPDDPESAEGYGPAVPVERAIGGSIDPYMESTTGVGLLNNFRGGTAMPFMAIIGSTAGNRFAVTVPSAKATAFDPGNREGLGTHAVSFDADGADAGAFIAHF
jgi:hypothetical protein